MLRREWWDGVMQDGRITLRQLRRSPGITLGIASILALGIGVNLVMFDVVDRLLLSPPPGIARAEGVRRVIPPHFNFFDRRINNYALTNYATYLDLRSVHGFALAAYGMPEDASLGRGREASRVVVNGASASFFTLLGVRPYLGRFYTPAEDSPPSGTAVAVVSHGFWKRVLGGDPGAIGKTLLIDGALFTVVGVAPPRFNGVNLSPVDVWLPMTNRSFAIQPNYLTDHGSLWMMMIGRLANGADERRVVEEASAAIVNGDERIRGAKGRARVELGSVIVGRGSDNRSEATFALLLLGVTGAVLLIACANVATILLTRAVGRQQETAIRLALGASRWRLVGQALLEGAAIGALAAAAALVVAQFARGALLRFVMPGVALDAGLSLRTVGAMVILVILSVMTTTLVPSLSVNRVDVAGALKGSSRSVADSNLRLRGALLVLQVAVSALLLVGAGLFVRSLGNAETIRTGVDTDRVLLAQVDLSAINMDTAGKNAFWQAAVERVRRLPHVTSVALTTSAPMRSSMSGTFIIPGRDSIPTLKSGGPYRSGVDDQFFVATGTRVVRGRAFASSDTRTSQRVIVINETMANRLWPGANPVGTCIRTFRADSIPCATIVGVVEDVHRYSLREDASYQYYMPYTQWRGARSTAMLIRLDSPPVSGTVERVRRGLQDVSPDTPFPSVQTYSDIIDPQLRAWKVGASMFTLFGVLAFAVALVGLYGLLAYSVAQRRFELGIRAALGAQRSDLIRLVARQAVRLVLLGLATGLGAAAVLSGRIAPLLVGVGPRDPATYIVTAALCVGVGVLATLVPARRAAASDPMHALRAE